MGIRTGSEKKYRLLSEIQRNGHPVEFDVLYYAQKKRASAIREEIGSKERVHPPVPARAEHADTQSGGLAQVGYKYGGCSGSAGIVSLIPYTSLLARLTGWHKFSHTGGKTVFRNKKSTSWECGPHYTTIGERDIFCPEIHPNPTTIRGTAMRCPSFLICRTVPL